MPEEVRPQYEDAVTKPLDSAPNYPQNSLRQFCLDANVCWFLLRSRVKLTIPANSHRHAKETHTALGQRVLTLRPEHRGTFSAFPQGCAVAKQHRKNQRPQRRKPGPSTVLMSNRKVKRNGEPLHLRPWSYAHIRDGPTQRGYAPPVRAQV